MTRHFKFSGTMISLEWLKLESPNLVHRYTKYHSLDKDDKPPL